MNKQQRQELEDMVRQLAEEPYNPSEKHIEEIKQRAFEEYEQIMAAKQKMKEKRKGTLRRVVVTAATIVCLLVGSTVIALLNPLQSGNADNFFRRAVIWVNDQLHLGIEFYGPKDEHKQADFSEGEKLKTIKEASIILDIPVVYIEEGESISIDEINVGEDISIDASVSIRYSLPDGILIIRSYKGTNSNFITISTDSAIVIDTPVGNMTIWETEAYIRGLLSFEDSYTFVFGSMDINAFIEYCLNLSIIN